MDAALAIIARGDRSVRQVRTALLAKPFDPDVADRVIERLLSRRILDDLKFARARVLARTARGIGIERIREELLSLGVDGELVEAALGEEVPDGPQWTETILRRRMEKRPDMTRAAACRFLASRGFAEDQIEKAVDALFGAEDLFGE